MHAYDHAKTRIMTTVYIIEIHVLEHVTFMYEANSFFFIPWYVVFFKEETGLWVLNPVKVNINAFISTDGRLSVNNLWGKQASFN